jgi:hypothetical protein
MFHETPPANEMNEWSTMMLVSYTQIGNLRKWMLKGDEKAQTIR